MSLRRNQQPAFGQAEPDGSLPPPPYAPVDSTRTSASQANRVTQQYAPPAGPPPGVRPMVASPRSSMSEAPLSPPNPFADPQQNTSMPSGPATAGYHNPHAPQRQASIAQHVRTMSNDMANLNVASPPGGPRRVASVKEDPLDFLKSFDTIFIVDDSASMQVNEMPDGSIGKSRWEEARDAVSGVVELAAKYDDDGVDVYFLNDERSLGNCRDPRQVLQAFDSIEPTGTTPTGTKLEILLLDYMDRIEEWKDRSSKGQAMGQEPKKRNYIIITDGSPTDDPESVIVTTARRLDQRNFPLAQIGIQFIQVGNDREATEALEDLDDALSKDHGIRDMVDTLTYQSMVVNADLIIKALLGGINRRLDRKKDVRNA